MEEKRLFFGLEVETPWPYDYPEGKIIEEKNRHMTLLFLGDYPMDNLCSFFPKPSFTLGPVGIFKEIIFLPKRDPKVAAYQMKFIEKEKEMFSYCEKVVEFGKKLGVKIQHEEFLPHVSVARAPKNLGEWRKSFKQLPFMVSAIHLYESKKDSQYQSLWKFPLKKPFYEIEHTADLAYKVFAEDFATLYKHAAIALSFTFPEILPFISFDNASENTEDIVITLNEIVTHADKEIGCPFKAVSFHGKETKSENLIEWEMVIDV